MADTRTQASMARRCADARTLGGQTADDLTGEPCLCEAWHCQGAVLPCRNVHGHYFFGCWCTNRGDFLPSADVRRALGQPAGRESACPWSRLRSGCTRSWAKIAGLTTTLC